MKKPILILYYGYLWSFETAMVELKKSGMLALDDRLELVILPSASQEVGFHVELLPDYVNRPVKTGSITLIGGPLSEKEIANLREAYERAQELTDTDADCAD